LIHSVHNNNNTIGKRCSLFKKITGSKQILIERLNQGLRQDISTLPVVATKKNHKRKRIVLPPPPPLPPRPPEQEQKYVLQYAHPNAEMTADSISIAGPVVRNVRPRLTISRADYCANWLRHPKYYGPLQWPNDIRMIHVIEPQRTVNFPWKFYHNDINTTQYQYHAYLYCPGKRAFSVW
jgi:hypothetical protein